MSGLEVRVWHPNAVKIWYSIQIMMNRKGGNLPLLFFYRLFAGLLVVGITLLGILLVYKATPAAQAAMPDLECRAMLPKLAAVDINGRIGLVQQESAPLYYKLEAHNLAALKMQINTCSPVVKDDGIFIADTAYTINWHASYLETSPNVCKIDAIAVGLATRHIYPRWNTPAADASSWSVFIGNLQIHESGHTKLDQQYAAALFSDLTSVPTQSCATIKQYAESIANERLAALDKANSSYDITTDHGRTQGVVIE